MHRSLRLGCEQLEPRRLLAALPEAQLFVYLVNEARHDPPAYEQRSGVNVDLSNVAPRPPLAVNENLFSSAQFKASEMAEHDYFDHQSAITGQMPNALVRVHGYDLPQHFEDDQNNVELNGTGTTRSTADEHLRRQILSEKGHREALLGIGSFFQSNVEIGAGYATNANTLRRHWWVAHVARTAPSKTFLTGVVYQDQNDNGRYDLNEGVAGRLVSAGALTTRTNAAGGWSIEVTDNTDYAVAIEVQGKPIVARASVAGDNRYLEFRIDSATTRLDFGDWLDSADVTPPTAELSASDLRTRRHAKHEIQITYQDDVQVTEAAIKTGNLRVTGPGGFDQTPTLISKTGSRGTWIASYSIAAPQEVWTFEHNGEYAVDLLTEQITDTSQNSAPAQRLGTFRINISDQFPNEDVDDNGLVTPLDALLVINQLNAGITNGFLSRYDVNRDTYLSPIDALLVINHLNQANGEGEQVSFSPIDLGFISTEKTHFRFADLELEKTARLLEALSYVSIRQQSSQEREH